MGLKIKISYWYVSLLLNTVQIKFNSKYQSLKIIKTKKLMWFNSFHQHFSGGWGYKPKFDKVKSNLAKAFPNQLEIAGEAVPGMSGCFEVVIVESGKVLHSKNNGQGYVDTGAKLEAICNGIKEALAK